MGQYLPNTLYIDEMVPCEFAISDAKTVTRQISLYPAFISATPANTMLILLKPGTKIFAKTDSGGGSDVIHYQISQSVLWECKSTDVAEFS